MPHFAGGKITASHSTVIEAAVEIIKTAQKQPEVTKIALGPIVRPLPTGSKRLKFKPIVGGLQATVRGTGTKQELFIYTKDPQITEKALIDAFNA